MGLWATLEHGVIAENLSEILVFSNFQYFKIFSIFKILNIIHIFSIFKFSVFSNFQYFQIFHIDFDLSIKFHKKIGLMGPTIFISSAKLH